jgi:hypothetical protein
MKTNAEENILKFSTRYLDLESFTVYLLLSGWLIEDG